MSLPRAPRYQSLDLWRGVACLTVLIFHATFYWKGDAGWSHALGVVFARLWLGVPLFFVISGYCIAASCDSARRKDGATWGFFVRRWRRIFPPFWIFLAAAVALVGGVELVAPGTFADRIHPIAAPWTLSAGAWLGNLALVETWRANFIGPEQQFFIGHAWTLCYEEQFYVLAGLVIWLAPKRMFAAFAAVTAFVLVSSFLPGAWRLDGTLADGRWFPFATGILVYWARNHANARAQRATIGVLVLALAVVCLRPMTPFTEEYITAFAFGVVLLLVSTRDRAIATHRWSRPLMWTGQMCYSVYLLHWPIVKLVSHLAAGASDPVILLVVLPICAGLSLAVAWGFHVAVERRFLSHATAPRARGTAALDIRRAHATSDTAPDPVRY